ncbi:uncharacterized protein PITG_21745 [Phytophthora infestans T30-4]|uniref:Uncharacterized protein n=1 Tax=Phytophthora infestans (strain T30-4) TaxID=403677 RepID=D0P4D2_PHYIT|nr:uncharacterized protein PITG_21745 [Phytophthora infestans T30-4]EEY64956.1 hypothetical protein PITG_21745 [Phytophthora infestans T30-4]|eukprot:XP_002894842.1 hypothetical protein PITG_21745 [Phytophthora infestans T30-4]
MACGSLDSASAQSSGMTVRRLAYAPKRTPRLPLQMSSGCEQLKRIACNSVLDVPAVKLSTFSTTLHTFSPLRRRPWLSSVNETITPTALSFSPLACCTPSNAILAS